jgi:uncharacterized protein
VRTKEQGLHGLAIAADDVEQSAAAGLTLRGVRAESISFASAGETCRGVIYRPDDRESDALSAVIVAHGFSATRLTQYDRRARRLVEAGVAVVDFDPRFIGMSSGQPRQRITPFDWLDDLRAAVAYVRDRSDINPQAVGLYGSSLGGGIAVALAAEDRGIRAIALDVPVLDGLRATPSPLRSRPALMTAVVRDAIGRRRQRAPLTLPVIGDFQPGAVIQHDVEGFWRALDELEGLEWVEPRCVVRHPETGEWRNEATALELLDSVRFRPSRRAANVRCPVLVYLSEDDRIVPYAATRKALERIPHADVRSLRGGHFAPFYGDGFQKTVAAQISFFAQHLAV